MPVYVNMLVWPVYGWADGPWWHSPFGTTCRHRTGDHILGRDVRPDPRLQSPSGSHHGRFRQGCSSTRDLQGPTPCVLRVQAERGHDRLTANSSEGNRGRNRSTPMFDNVLCQTFPLFG